MIKCWEYVKCTNQGCIARKDATTNCWNIKLRCDHVEMFCFSKDGCTKCRYFKSMNKMDHTIDLLKGILKK